MKYFQITSSLLWLQVLQLNTDGTPTPTHDQLKQHIICISADSFMCSLCHKTFKQMCTVLRHVRCVHLGIRKYSCSFCGQAFGAKCGRDRHEKICKKNPQVFMNWTHIGAYSSFKYDHLVHHHNYMYHKKIMQK